MPPRFSVAIPAYNCADLLRETLLSVLAQEIPSNRMEILVVDDGSTDDPKTVVDSIGQGRVRYHRQENQGPCATFNTCVKLATGELVHLLHGDDRVLPGFYERVESAFADPQLGMFTCRCREIDQHGEFLQLSYLPPPNESGAISNYDRLIIPRNHVRTPGVVLRREVYAEVGAYLPELNHTQDWHMWLKAARWGKVWHEVEPLAEYRLHPQSDTNKKANNGDYLWESWQCVANWSQGLPLQEAFRAVDIMDKAVVRLATADLAHWKFDPTRLDLLSKQFASRMPHLRSSFLASAERRAACQTSGGTLKHRRRIAIFGSGIIGQKVFASLDRNREEPIAFLDNNTAMQGNTLHGLPVLDPALLLHLDFDHVILASAYHSEMATQLRHLGLDLRQTSPVST